jgi:hypothetical protein
MAVVPTAGATTVVVVMAIAAADLSMKASAVTVASAAGIVAASMEAVADFMEAAGFTVAVAVSMAVEEAMEAGITNCQES